MDPFFLSTLESVILLLFSAAVKALRFPGPGPEDNTRHGVAAGAGVG